MDGVEAKHSVTKLLQRQVTNSKLYQRLHTILGNYVMRDAAVDDARVCEYSRYVYMTDILYSV